MTIEIDGKTYTAVEVAKIVHRDESTVRKRWRTIQSEGLEPQALLSNEFWKNRIKMAGGRHFALFRINDVNMTVADIMEMTGLTESTIRSRIKLLRQCGEIDDANKIIDEDYWDRRKAMRAHNSNHVYRQPRSCAQRNQERAEALDKIPGPSEVELKMEARGWL